MRYTGSDKVCLWKISIYGMYICLYDMIYGTRYTISVPFHYEFKKMPHTWKVDSLNICMTSEIFHMGILLI